MELLGDALRMAATLLVWSFACALVLASFILAWRWAVTIAGWLS